MSAPGRKIRRAVGRLAPPGTRRRAALASLADRPQAERAAAYAAWMARVEPASLAAPVDPGSGPLLSVVVPAFNTPERYLTAAVDSVLAQSYPRWELCLVDGSTDAGRSAAIAAQAQRDDRIRLVTLGTNRGIAGNTNAGIAAAGGRFTGFLDHDDTLAPHALNEVAAALLAHPGTAVLYSDEDKLSRDGRQRSDPMFKPGWSPDVLLESNYACHFAVVRTDLLRAAGGVREGFEGAQDYDLLLRLLDGDPAVHHIAKVLYHWRFAEGSTARGPQAKRGAGEAGLRALRDCLARRRIAASAEPVPGHPTRYRLRYRVESWPAVHFLGGALSSDATLPATDYPDLRQLGSAAQLVDAADGDVLFVADLDAQPLHPVDAGWLRELAAVAIRPGTGCVTPARVGGTDRSPGIGYGASGGRLHPLLAGQVWPEFSSGSPASSGSPLAFSRNILAAGGCVALSVRLARALLSAGAEPTPVSLSLAAHREGARNVYWPYSRVRSDGVLPEVALAEAVDDPYLNPNLRPDQSGLPATGADVDAEGSGGSGPDGSDLLGGAP